MTDGSLSRCKNPTRQSPLLRTSIPASRFKFHICVLFLLQEALAQISEYSEAGITVRGTYFTPGKPAPEGERKLYLAIESTNELAVSKAKIEITRLIKEELLKLQSSAHHIMNKARYKVV